MYIYFAYVTFVALIVGAYLIGHTIGKQKTIGVVSDDETITFI